MKSGANEQCSKIKIPKKKLKKKLEAEQTRPVQKLEIGSGVMEE